MHTFGAQWPDAHGQRVGSWPPGYRNRSRIRSVGRVGTGISLNPVWWVEPDERELAIQVTHPEGARFADRSVSEAGAEVKVELATSDLAPVDVDDEDVTLSTLRVRLRAPMADRRLVMLVDGEPISTSRVTPTEQSLSTELAAEPTRHRAGEPVRAGIPEDGRVPRYYAVKTQLLELTRAWGEGAVLPSERELAERFGVARMTLRQAVSELVLEGKLQRRHGSGTYVMPPKLVQPLSLVSLSEGIRRQGGTPARKLVTLEHLPADPTLAADLRIEPGAQVLHIERTVEATGHTVGLESTYLAAARFSSLLDVYDPTTSLHTCLANRLGVVFAEAEERVETVLATPREAKLIGTNPALPMLLLHRMSFDPDGVPIERVRSLFRGDRFSFSTRLRPED